jgi:hypothetical protein
MERQVPKLNATSAKMRTRLAILLVGIEKDAKGVAGFTGRGCTQPILFATLNRIERAPKILHI